VTLILSSIGAILVFLVVFVLLKKSKKLQKSESKKSSADSDLATIFKTDKPQAYRAILEVDELNNSIRPEGYQQRTLDREVGGLEEGKKGTEKQAQEEQKHHHEKHVEDVWDKRSDEIDKIGSIDPLAGHDKESMTWRLKKIKLKIGKHLHRDDHGKHADETGKNYDSRYANQQGGFTQMIKARQDFGHEGGGGMER